MNNLEQNQEFEYMMLGRLKADCDYFLNSCPSEAVLYYKSIEAHINGMFTIYNSLAVKPIWLTREDIKQYETNMFIINHKNN